MRIHQRCFPLSVVRAMNLDRHGKLRGSCSRCECKVFTTKPSSVKCRCGHAPTVHVHLDSASDADGHLARQEDTAKIFDITSAIGSHQGILLWVVFHFESSVLKGLLPTLYSFQITQHKNFWHVFTCRCGYEILS